MKDLFTPVTKRTSVVILVVDFMYMPKPAAEVVGRRWRARV